MVFPRKISVPAVPARLVLARSGLLAGEAEIADRDDVLSCAAAIPVGESIELLDVAGRQPGLPLDPGAQPRLQRTMGELERTGWQCAAILDGQDAWIARGHGDQHCDEIGRDRILAGNWRGRCACLANFTNRAHQPVPLPGTMENCPVNKNFINIPRFGREGKRRYGSFQRSLSVPDGIDAVKGLRTPREDPRLLTKVK